MNRKKKTFYEKYGKRFFDIFMSLLFILLFWWVYLVLGIIVRINMGSPIIYKQPRPGKNEKIFELIKYRSMTETKDNAGNLLSDEDRLTNFGKVLRRTSLDELPEILNILKGEMSFVGPRPFLVRDLVFMNEKQKKRHNVTPGLTGLAQISGRNNLSWEDKISLDLYYIKNITFFGDIKIIVKTFLKVFVNISAVDVRETNLELDFGDYLLENKRIDLNQYYSCQKEALNILKDFYESRK